MEKMGMKNRIDLVRYAMLQGWLEDIWRLRSFPLRSASGKSWPHCLFP